MRKPSVGVRSPARLTVKGWKEISEYLEPYEPEGFLCMEECILNDRPHESVFGELVDLQSVKIMHLANQLN